MSLPGSLVCDRGFPLCVWGGGSNDDSEYVSYFSNVIRVLLLKGGEKWRGQHPASASKTSLSLRPACKTTRHQQGPQ